MAEQDGVRKESETIITAESARKDFTEILGRSRYADERFVITYHGDEHAALIGPKDLERLRAMDSAA